MTTRTAPASNSESRRLVPSWFRRRVGDPLAKRVARLVGTERFGVLWSTRRDGTWRKTALGIWPQDGRRHLVALFGETYWVADLRAGRPARITSGSCVHAVTLHELDAEQATDFWIGYARQFPGAAARYTGIGREPSREEAAAIAAGHPVFLIDDEHADEREGGPVSWRRTIGIGLGVGLGGAVVNAVLATVLVAVTGVDAGFQAIGAAPVAIFTLAGMLAASVALGVLARRSPAPLRIWPRLATAALLVSWLPDLMLLVNPVTPMGTATPAHVAILALLHLPPYLLALRVLPTLHGLRDRDV